MKLKRNVMNEIVARMGLLDTRLHLNAGELRYIVSVFIKVIVEMHKETGKSVFEPEAKNVNKTK